MSIQQAKDILETLVVSNHRKGASYVPSISGSPAVVHKKLDKVYRLLCKELGQSPWREVANGWLPAATENTDTSSTLVVWDGSDLYHGAAYDYTYEAFVDAEGTWIDGATHYMEVNPTPPGKVKL